VEFSSSRRLRVCHYLISIRSTRTSSIQCNVDLLCHGPGLPMVISIGLNITAVPLHGLLPAPLPWLRGLRVNAVNIESSLTTLTLLQMALAICGSKYCIPPALAKPAS